MRRSVVKIVSVVTLGLGTWGFEFGTCSAQNVGISASGIVPDNSAMLDVVSTTRGLLIPRLTQAERALISLPATSLLIYQTDATPGYYYNSGIPAAPVWERVGTATTGGGWTDDGTVVRLTTSTDNVGIGTAAPTNKLEVVGNALIQNVTISSSLIYVPNAGLQLIGGGPQTTRAYIDLPNNQGINIFGPTGLGAQNIVLDNRSNGGFILLNNSNVGIGTTTPGYKLQVAGGSGTTTSIFTDGYIQDVSGVVHGNYVSSHSWTISTGSVGIFGQNGDISENSREWGVGPHGNRVILWKGGNDAVSDADGGWNSGTFAIDNTKTYRVSVWIKKTNSSDGTTYFGISGSNITDLNGVAETNPYFFCGDLPQLDRWYLLVGYIHASNDASTAAYGGIYDGVTGQKVQSFGAATNCGSEFKFTSSAATQVHRSYLYYDITLSDRQYWWDPRFEEVNGKEPTIQALLGISGGATGTGTTNYLSKWTGITSLGNSQLFDNGTNVGIGTITPGYKLDVNGNLRATDIYLTDGVQIEGLSGRNYFRDVEAAGNLRVGAVWGMPGIYAEAGVGVVGGAGGTSLQNNSLFVTTAGNVGIGTTSPAQKLQVAGNIDVSGLSNYYSINNRTDLGLFGNGNYSLYLAAPEGVVINLDANNNTTATNFHITRDVTGAVSTNALFSVIESTGNVGIGTTTPGFKLHVPSGYIGTDYINTTDNSVASGVTGVMVKQGDNYLRTGTAAAITTFLNTSGGWIQNQYAGAQSASSWISGETRTGGWFRNSASGTGLYNETNATGIYSPGAGIMAIYNNGSLGIGTTGPSSRLHVYDAGSDPFRVESGSTEADVHFITSGATEDWQVGANTTGFYAYSDVGGYRLVINQGTGNVGIGTTGPSEELHVYAATGSAMTLIQRAAAANGWAALGLLGANQNWYMYIPTGATNLTWGDGATAYMALTPAGNLGIGTGGPGYKLDVVGDIRSTNKIWANANGASYFRGGDDAEFWDVNIANTVGIYGVQNSTIATIRLGSSGGEISGSLGNIGIGTTTPGFKLHVPSGYIGTDYINTTDNSVASGVTGVMVKQGDNYLRTGTAAAIRTFLNGTGNGWIENQFAGAQTADHWISGSSRAAEVYAGNWFRVDGGGGIYWQSYGGGWYMSDATWIRSYNSKNVYVDQVIRADGGFQVDGNQVIDADAGWHRSYGNTGWYNGTWGGGWYMIDGTWIRGYNGKSLWMGGGLIGGDGGLTIGYGGAGSPGGGAIIAGNVGIGTTSPAASAKLDVSSTTQGFLPPRMTTAERNAIGSPATGLLVYNTTTNCLDMYTGSAWESVKCASSSCPTATNPSTLGTNWYTTTFQYGYEFNQLITKTICQVDYLYSGTIGTTGWVKIYTSGGSLLSSTAITTSSTTWTNLSISPIALSAGSSYVIVCDMNNGNAGGNFNPPGSEVYDSSVITYVTGRYNSGSCCSFPTQTWGGYWGDIKMKY